MKSRRNIIIILGIVLVLGLLIEVARTEYLFKLRGNENGYSLDVEGKKVDAISQYELKGLKKEKYLILYDDGEDEGSSLKDNISKVLQYMKKDYAVYDCRNYKQIDDEYSAIILALEDLSHLAALDEIVNYVSKGGRVFFSKIPAKNGAFYSIYHKIGIYETGGFQEEDGVRLLSNVLIKGSGYAADQSFLHNTVLSVRLKEDCTVHAETVDNGVPLLWEVPYGSGKIMVFNGTMMYLKLNRGIIAGALSLLMDDFIYPVINVKLSFIDDFPAPIPKEYVDNIYKGYGRNLSNFYREVWWSDILKGAKNYDLKYNGMVIETYNDRVAPPFEGGEGIDLNALIIYGREIIKNGGEIGIHGYNHQPLVEEGFIGDGTEYVPWESVENMMGSLKEVKDYVGAVFPYYQVRSYVPPSNILSPLGRQAVAGALPEVKVISSVYMDDFSGDGYIQEYEACKDGIIEVPRMTFGYDDSEQNNWAILNGVTFLGVFSHFIHPDDAVDQKRSKGRTWEQLYKEYDSLLKKVYNNFRWLRSMTVSQGASEVKKFQETEVYIEYGEDAIDIYCNNFRDDMYFILRTDKKVGAAGGCNIYSIDHEVYLVHGKNAHFTIGLGR